MHFVTTVAKIVVGTPTICNFNLILIACYRSPYTLSRRKTIVASPALDITLYIKNTVRVRYFVVNNGLTVLRSPVPFACTYRTMHTYLNIR